MANDSVNHFSFTTRISSPELVADLLGRGAVLRPRPRSSNSHRLVVLMSARKRWALVNEARGQLHLRSWASRVLIWEGVRWVGRRKVGGRWERSRGGGVVFVDI